MSKTKYNTDFHKQLLYLSNEELSQLSNVILESKILISWFNIIQFTKDIFRIKPSNIQNQFLADFTNMKSNKFKYKKHIISGGRGAGKTLIASIAALWSASLLPYIIGKEYRVILMGGSERQARKSYAYITKAIESTPLLESIVIGRPYKEKTIFHKGELLVLPASEKAARHEHVDMLLIDEAALVSENVMKAALPIIGESSNPKLVLTSTPSANPTAIFSDMLLNSESWNIDKVYIFSALDATWKDTKEIEVFKKKYDIDEFKREFEGKLVVHIKNAFDYTKWSKYGREHIEYHHNLPTYASIDWGFSKESPTALSILQVQDNRFNLLTSHYIQGTNEDYILNRIISSLNRYNVREVYADASHPAQNNKLIQEGIKLIPIQASGKKSSMIYRLKTHLESGKILFPINLKQMLYEFSTYHWDIDKSGRLIPRSKHDHIIDSLSIFLEGYYNREVSRPVASFITY